MLLALTASTAFAVEPAQHTVAWYRAHREVRENVLRTCQNDHSHDDDADSLLTAAAPDPEADPAYYGHNGPLIAMTLAICARNGAPQSWCLAARTAAAQQKP
jgi:hypothetical protein